MKDPATLSSWPTTYLYRCHLAALIMGSARVEGVLIQIQVVRRVVVVRDGERYTPTAEPPALGGFNTCTKRSCESWCLCGLGQHGRSRDIMKVI